MSLTDFASPEPVVVPISNPGTSVIVAELIAIKKAIEEGQERKETPAPTQIRFPFTGHLRLRTVSWHLHPAAAGTYALIIGVERKSTILVAAGNAFGCIPEPLTLTLEPGNNIRVIDATTGVDASVAQVVDSFLLAYAESNDD